MESRSNIYKLSQQNIAFLRIFQTIGFLPFRLTSDESALPKCAACVLFIMLTSIVALHSSLIESELERAVLFYWDIVTLVIGQVCTYVTKNRQIALLKLIGEIDAKIIHNLGMKEQLKILNVKTQRGIAFVWILYGLFNVYYPATKIIKYEFSMQFFDALLRIFTWAFLIHMNLTKFLYFFSLLSVRLEIVKVCLKDIHEEEMNMMRIIMIKEVVGSRKVNSKMLSSYLKVMALKEIYYRCWLFQDNALQMSGFFLLIYFIGYVGQLMNITFFYMKIAILEDTFVEHMLEIIIYFTLLNVFSIFFFYVSHRIHSMGLKIAGFIHEIAHNGIGDTELVRAVQLFSLQISQQQITHINIFGIYYYDRSNINGFLILYSSLFYEAFHINLKIIDLKEKAKELGVSPEDVDLTERSITI